MPPASAVDSRASHVHYTRSSPVLSCLVSVSRCARCLLRLSQGGKPLLLTTRDVLLLLHRNHCHHHHHHHYYYHRHFPSSLPLPSFSRRPRAIFVTRARWWKSQRNFSAAAASSWRGIIQIRSRVRAAYAILHDTRRRDETRHDTQCHRRIHAPHCQCWTREPRRDSPARACLLYLVSQINSRRECARENSSATGCGCISLSISAVCRHIVIVVTRIRGEVHRWLLRGHGEPRRLLRREERNTRRWVFTVRYSRLTKRRDSREYLEVRCRLTDDQRETVIVF